MLPAGSGVLPSLWRIAVTEGRRGLFAGLGERLLWSALFGGIGFGTLEWCKTALGVADEVAEEK